MTNEIERMTDREADAAVDVEVMGREVQRFDSGRIRQYGGKRHASGGWSWQSLPHYSTDDNAARLMRNRIAEMGLAKQYMIEVANQVWPVGTPVSTFQGADDFSFKMHNATPRQQVNAALRAVRKRKED